MQIDIYKAGANALILSVLARYLKPFIPKILQDGQLPDSQLKPRGERYVGKEGDELRQIVPSDNSDARIVQK